MSKTSKFSAMRSGLTDFGIAERPCWRCQANITWAGVQLWLSAHHRLGSSANGFSLEGCSLGITIRGNTADGRPGLGKNPKPVIELAHLWLSKERVDFDLVDSRCHRCVSTQCLQVFNHEVAHPDGPDASVF